MPELPYDQWIIVARDLFYQQVTILKAPYENQVATCVDIFADGSNPRTINVEAPDDGHLMMLLPNEYKKL